MSKIIKIIIALLLILALVFAFQKTAHSYIEGKINEYLSSYFVSAKLHRLERVTLKSKFFPRLSLMCEIKIEKNNLLLSPVGNNLITKLLPDDIKIPIF